MNNLPVTPEQNSAAREYSHSVNSMMLQCPATQLKVHPHGLSAKKQMEDTTSQGDSMLSNNFDISLDCIKRSKQVGHDPEGVKSTNESNALDQIDINKMFPNLDQYRTKIDDGETNQLELNYSPIKIELSSPTKEEKDKQKLRDEPPQKKMKLELEAVPNLAQTASFQDDGHLSSPEAIEMIETKSSPMKEFPDINFEQDKTTPIIEMENTDPKPFKQESTAGTPGSDDGSDSMSSLPKLTPVSHGGNPDITRGKPLKYSKSLFLDLQSSLDSSSQAVHIRNEELVEEIHSLHKQLNTITANCDMAFNEYKNIKSQIKISTSGHEAEIYELNERIQNISRERDTAKDRIETLKQKLSESRDEINMLNQNQSILQKKYEAATRDSDRWKRLSNEMEESFLEMRDLALERKEKAQKLEDDIKIMSEKIATSESDLKGIESVADDFKKKNRQLEEELSRRVEEVAKLEHQLDESIESQKDASEKVTDQVHELTVKKSELESRLESLQNEQKEEMASLSAVVSQKESELRDAVESCQKITEKFQILQTELGEKDAKMTILQKEYEDLNDETEICKAEVIELNATVEELKEVKLTLQTSILHLEEKVQEWVDKFNKEKSSPSLESEHLKSLNIEAEHLAELEELHVNLSSLQESLRTNSEITRRLREENEQLKANQTNSEQNEHEKRSREQEVLSLQKEIDDWRERYNTKEKESNKSLKLLAEDLYIQYSSKHEQKVKLLKKGYETKYQGKLDRMSLQNEGLAQDIDQLKSQLNSERKEKQKLLELLEKRNAE